MNREEARELARSLFLKTLPHLQVGPKLREMVHLRDGVIEIAGDHIPLHDRRPVRVVAMGKAAIEMAHSLAEILPGVRLRGVVAAPSLPKYPLPGFEYFAGGHPYPNEQSWQAAEAALALLDQRNVTADDLVIFLISGGGSSLLEMPLKPVGGGPVSLARMEPSVSLPDLRDFYELLVTSGATIRETNIVRKQYSAVKGGRLARAAYPARQITLYVSDVPDAMPDAVASGPSIPDTSSPYDCPHILKKYGLRGRLPLIYRTILETGVLQETVKPDHPCFHQNRYHCLLSSRDAVEKSAQFAEERGVIPKIDNRCDEWNVKDAADYLLGRLAELRKENPGRPVAVISGGELSCPVKGDGMGGRNQAFVLDCVTKISGRPIVVLSAGTDGIDGNSSAAGAFADGESLARAHALGLDPEEFQRRSDSFHFFEKLGDTIITGPTGTNVRDLRILLVFPE